MHRTEGDGFVVNGGKNQFDPGDPLIPTPASMVTHEWCNAVQEELALTIEGLGGTLSTAALDSYGQLLARLNARFGRLDQVNSWAAAQTFAGGVAGNPSFSGNVSVGGTLGVTGATTLSSLSVTGNATLGDSTSDTLTINSTTTIAGPLTVNALVTLNDGGNTLQLKPGAEDHTFLEFFARTATPTTRSAYIGYAATAATKLSLANQIASGDVEILPGSGGKVTTSGNVQLMGSAPLSSTAFTNTVTPANICKAHAKITTNGSGGATVNGGFNVASVSVSGGTMTVTFAQAFVDANYTVKSSMSLPGSFTNETSQTTTTVNIQGTEISGGGSVTATNFATSVRTVYVTCHGAQ